MLLKFSNLILGDVKSLLLFTKNKTLYLSNTILMFAHHPLSLNMLITIWVFCVVGMFHVIEDKSLPICYQCLELQNTCLDFHQSENFCLITSFPPPYWWKSSKCEMKGSNGLSECFCQSCWKWLRHWLANISSEKAIP